MLFDRTYISYNYVMMKPNQIGNAITVGPYVTLAKDAIPMEGFGKLNDMTLTDWLKDQGFETLTGLK